MGSITIGRCRESQAGSPAKTGRSRQAPHQETHECLHGVGEGRAPQDPESLPRHAQLEYLQNPGCEVEGDVQCRETTLL